LDSLADLVCPHLFSVGLYQVSFGVAPSVLAFTLGLRTTVDTMTLSFFLLSGLSRLARFNITAASLPKDASGKAKYFEGFPIPTTLGLVTMMGVWLWNGWHEGKEGLPLGVLAQGKPWEVHVASVVFLLWGCAMVSKSLKVPKL
jgi:CDP-diacylglycerol---serine O-phosphatidyltransferase